MDQITLKANINECIVENWQSNTGEINARVMNVEMCEDLCSCARQFVTFELADGTIYESLVVDGRAKIPFIERPQFIKIGLYAENIDGDECEKRYSAHPANVYVNMGGYKNGSSEPPKPTPGDYAELLEQIAGIKEDTTESLADLEKGTIKVITEPCHIADLEKGTYVVKNDFVGEYNGKVTIANIKDDGETIDDNYFAVNCGLLVVFENIKRNEEDGTEISLIGFTAQGMITVPNKSYTGDFLTLQQTIRNATSIQGYLLRSFKTTESAEPVEPNKWYSQMPEIVMSDIPVTAMVDKITKESTIYDFPNAVAVKDYVNEQLGAIDNGRY